ncbi:MAG: hypothetical protein ACTSRA_19865 [Promethearchaeota archaeon]
MSEKQDDKVEIKDDGFKIRKSVDFKLDMINTQQQALLKTIKRYEQRDNPLEKFIENLTVKAVDLFLKANEKIVNAIPNETRLKIQKGWQDFLLAF